MRLRMKSLGLKLSDQYYQLLLRSPAEWDELVESVVVAETWFFRDREPFAALVSLLLEEWLPARPARPARLLSLPCSSGEEPYSMAMALLDAGVAPELFEITAVDISHRALAHARRGVYGRNSFRDKDLGFRDRYFRAAKDGFALQLECARPRPLLSGQPPWGGFPGWQRSLRFRLLPQPAHLFRSADAAKGHGQACRTPRAFRRVVCRSGRATPGDWDGLCFHQYSHGFRLPQTLGSAGIPAGEFARVRPGRPVPSQPPLCRPHLPRSTRHSTRGTPSPVSTAPERWPIRAVSPKPLRPAKLACGATAILRRCITCWGWSTTRSAMLRPWNTTAGPCTSIRRTMRLCCACPYWPRSTGTSRAPAPSGAVPNVSGTTHDTNRVS